MLNIPWQFHPLPILPSPGGAGLGGRRCSLRGGGGLWCTHGLSALCHRGRYVSHVALVIRYGLGWLLVCELIFWVCDINRPKNVVWGWYLGGYCGVLEFGRVWLLFRGCLLVFFVVTVFSCWRTKPRGRLFQKAVFLFCYFVFNWMCACDFV